MRVIADSRSQAVDQVVVGQLLKERAPILPKVKHPLSSYVILFNQYNPIS
jgi:hypothetical protein